MQDIKTILELIKTDSSTMGFEKDGLSLVSLLLDIAEADIVSEDCRQAVETIERIRNANSDTTRIVSMFSSRIATLGMAAYSAKNYAVAEVAFKMIAESGDTSAKNNYAYMIRRHEIAFPSKRDHIIALRMLQEGVKEGDAFSLVNTALVFALMLGDDESWHLADSIFERLSGFGGMLVSSWWEGLAKEGDNEGYLVTFFLLRHGKIDNDSLGSIKGIAARLKKSIKGFPEWIARDYSIKTLDDIFACVGIPDYYSMLEDFIGKMSHTRENADKIAEAITSWKLWPVYRKLRAELPSQVLPYPGELKPLYAKLFTDFADLLTSEELAKLKASYKENFSIPLPGEDE